MMFETKFLKLNFVPKIQLGNCLIDYAEKEKYLGFINHVIYGMMSTWAANFAMFMVQQIDCVVNFLTFPKMQKTDFHVCA